MAKPPMIDEKTPCAMTVVPLSAGGISVSIFVPTYGGGVKMEITVERDEDGDWRVYLPTAAEHDRSEPGFDIEDHTDHPELISWFNGMAYFGAPDVPVRMAR